MTTKDGILFQPLFAILRNGEPLEPMGITFAYPRTEIEPILLHLKAVSDDEFSFELVSWQAVQS